MLYDTILVGGLNPSEKYEFVSWDDDIPNIWENVPNDQPVIYLYLLDPNLFRLEGCMNPPGFFDLFAREDHLDSLSVSLGG